MSFYAGDASVVLEVPGSSVTIEPTYGGRLSSWLVNGSELLWQSEGEKPGASHPFGWGSFVMAPFAGRIRRGQFAFGGVTHSLPITMAPHAIHGTVYDSPWEVVETGGSSTQQWCELEVRLDDPWPFRGVVRQRIEIGPNILTQTLLLVADQPMPVTMGWHPWFPRSIAGALGPIEWSFEPGGVSMMKRDDDGMTSAELVEVPAGPWDDCFVGVGDVTVKWPGLLEVVISHDCPVVVLFDGLDHAVCVEPQTGPPNAVELWPQRCATTHDATQIRASTTWTWRKLGA
jgi:aldose 1-epimerase